MSFRDLDSGAKISGRATKRQPTQRRAEESSFERDIRTNITEMQDAIRSASEQLDRVQRSCLTRRVRESLDKQLDQSRKLAQVTEQLFRDWTVHLAGEPLERQRKKHSYDKLQKGFEEEAAHLQEVANRVLQAQQEAAAGAGAPPVPEELPAMDILAGFDGDGSSDAEDLRLLYDEQAQVEDAAIQNRIAREREEGIRKVQGQVTEVNQMFRDLASMVAEQGSQLESIDEQAQISSAHTRQTVQELHKAAKRQTNTKENLCYLLVAAVMLLCFLVLPHMHSPSQYAPHAPPALVAGNMGTRVAVLRGNGVSGVESGSESVNTVHGATVAVPATAEARAPESAGPEQSRASEAIAPSTDHEDAEAAPANSLDSETPKVISKVGHPLT